MRNRHTGNFVVYTKLVVNIFQSFASFCISLQDFIFKIGVLEDLGGVYISVVC